MPISPRAFISDLADVEDGAAVAGGASVWQWTKVRHGASIGENTNVGGFVYVGVDVRVGKNCKVENAAQLFEGAVVGDYVFIGPGVLLLNDRYPRATTPQGAPKAKSDWSIKGVTVDDGASLGGGVVAVPGIHVGEWALIGAGSVITRDVDAYALVIGNPGRRIGTVCRCAEPVSAASTCNGCGMTFALRPQDSYPVPA